MVIKERLVEFGLGKRQGLGIELGLQPETDCELANFELLTV